MTDRILTQKTEVAGKALRAAFGPSSQHQLLQAMGLPDAERLRGERGAVPQEPDILGGKFRRVPHELHERMLARAARGDISITTPSQRVRYPVIAISRSLTDDDNIVIDSSSSWRNL